MDTQTLYDVFIVGAGINGAGIGNDASSRGLKVLLVDQSDLACGTSSQSSKLIHGGLRYLEQYDFALVHESLTERQHLLKHAPHLVHPMRFVLPYHQFLRPYWFLRLGLLLYDMLGPTTQLQRSKAIRFNALDLTSPLKHNISRGFIYSDCITDDARLVISNALRIKENGGHVLTYTKCTHATYDNKEWKITLQNQHTHENFHVRAKVLINATGPWANRFIKETLKIEMPDPVKLVKGTHIILPKLYEQNQAYSLQTKDRRVVFVIPYLKDFTLIGTTESLYIGDPKDAKPSTEEIDYLCHTVNMYFSRKVGRKDIVNAYAGVRPLFDIRNSPLGNLHRGYKLDQSVAFDNTLIHVFGGKLTTYRVLSEKVVNLLKPFFHQLRSPITAYQYLPGGNLGCLDFNVFKEVLFKQYSSLPISLLTRYALQYGSNCFELLGQTRQTADLGADLGHSLYEKEVDYLIEREWASQADDILWRRTHLGLVFTSTEKAALETWLLKRKTNPVAFQKVFSLLPSMRE